VEAIRHEVWIAAGKDKVFQAITDRQGLDAWWGPALNGEPQVGYVVEFAHFGVGNPPLQMRIMDLVPNERLLWRCVSDFIDPGNPASEWLGTRILFELEEGDGVTVLQFLHTGWPKESRWYGFCNYQWGVALTNLKHYCETGAHLRTEEQMEMP
jgi:uncharacterized protein YndB with AHSA1/START domain